MGEYRTPLPFRFGARLRLGKVVDTGSEPPENLPSSSHQCGRNAL